jgi:hypothetical protein
VRDGSANVAIVDSLGLSHPSAQNPHLPEASPSGFGKAKRESLNGLHVDICQRSFIAFVIVFPFPANAPLGCKKSDYGKENQFYISRSQSRYWRI